MTDRERYFNDILCEMETARDRLENLSKEEIQKIESIIRVANQMLTWDKEFKEELLNEK